MKEYCPYTYLFAKKKVELLDFDISNLKQCMEIHRLASKKLGIRLFRIEEHKDFMKSMMKQ